MLRSLLTTPIRNRPYGPTLIEDIFFKFCLLCDLKFPKCMLTLVYVCEIVISILNDELENVEIFELILSSRVFYNVVFIQC